MKCSNCDFIFIVHPSDYDEQPITQDTNIDQSALLDLLNMQHVRKTKVTIDEISDESDDIENKSLMSIEDFDAEVVDAEDEKVEYADLPDLSEYEDMINWGDDTDSEELSETVKQNLTNYEASCTNKIRSKFIIVL